MEMAYNEYINEYYAKIGTLIFKMPHKKRKLKVNKLNIIYDSIMLNKCLNKYDLLLKEYLLSLLFSTVL